MRKLMTYRRFMIALLVGMLALALALPVMASPSAPSRIFIPMASNGDAGVRAMAVTFDPGTGTGFVGKGDVQLKFGWNNKALNDNADSVEFRVKSEVVTEVSWECTNSNNDNIQERERTTTSSTQGVVSHIARDNKKQITGFNLTGKGTSTTEGSTTDGPALNSCPSDNSPSDNSPWSLTTPAGAPVEISSTGGLQVSKDGTEWFNLE
jgi:hypothetical protein